MPSKTPDEPAAQEPAEVGAETVQATTMQPGVVARLAAEYGQYVARETLSWYGVPVYAAGAAVAASHPGVPEWLEAGMIERVGG